MWLVGRRPGILSSTHPLCPNPFSLAPTDINYLDVDLNRQEAVRRYYAANAPRMVAVKRQYDPDDFFLNPYSVPLELEEPPGLVKEEEEG